MIKWLLRFSDEDGNLAGCACLVFRVWRVGNDAGRGLRARSTLLVAQRTSICTFRPAVQPNACSSCTNAVWRDCASGSSAESVVSTPMRRMRSGCCALAAIGQAAAAPASSVMNVRRLMANMAPPSSRLRRAS
jgi:hypothetical protein